MGAGTEARFTNVVITPQQGPSAPRGKLRIIDERMPSAATTESAPWAPATPWPVVPTVLVTLAVGIALDARGAWWAPPLVSAATWSVLGWIMWHATARERRELTACVALATLGELFLKDVWGLYEYRLLNLPLFIPPGHAVVYAAASRMSRAAPVWLPAAVVTLFGGYVTYAAWHGFDTFGAAWFIAFVAYVRLSANPRLCATLFVFALAIEWYGTSLAGWRYVTVEPWFGLTTTNPPVWIGAVYCTLESLVQAAVAVCPTGRPGPIRLAVRRVAALL